MCNNHFCVLRLGCKNKDQLYVMETFIPYDLFTTIAVWWGWKVRIQLCYLFLILDDVILEVDSLTSQIGYRIYSRACVKSQGVLHLIQVWVYLWININQDHTDNFDKRRKMNGNNTIVEVHEIIAVIKKINSNNETKYILLKHIYKCYRYIYLNQYWWLYFTIRNLQHANYVK